MRSFFLLFIACASLASLASPAHATRFFGFGQPTARQRQHHAYMLNGRRVRRPHHHAAPARDKPLARQ